MCECPRPAVIWETSERRITGSRLPCRLRYCFLEIFQPHENAVAWGQEVPLWHLLTQTSFNLLNGSVKHYLKTCSRISGPVELWCWRWWDGDGGDGGGGGDDDNDLCVLNNWGLVCATRALTGAVWPRQGEVAEWWENFCTSSCLGLDGQGRKPFSLRQDRIWDIESVPSLPWFRLLFLKV